MRSLLCIVVALPVAGFSQSGLWTGHIRTDDKLLLSQSKEPEFLKLMAYTIGRLHRATLTLTLQANGQFEWLFDDGYRADREDVRGRWHIHGSALLLDVSGKNGHTEKLKLTDGNRKFSTSFDDIPGVMCDFRYGK